MVVTKSSSPESFFQQRVLASSNAVDTLKLWISVLGSRIIRKLKTTFTKPEIWMLTGLIELEHCKIKSCESKDPNYKANLSLDKIVEGVPVHLSGGYKGSSKDTTEIKISDKLVWLASYHRLDVKWLNDVDETNTGWSQQRFFGV